MIQAYFKGKSDIQFWANEDFKTSSSIGLLQYLPDNEFWNIIRNSCVGFKVSNFGEIHSFNFWEHTDPTYTTNKNYVEPDVWIETENYDVLIEAKVYDTGGQYNEQWKKEIQSILNEQKNRSYQKPIILIALGGNGNLKNQTIEVNGENHSVFKCSWYNLVNAIVNESNLRSHNDNVRRILDDVIQLFARQGVMVIEWLDSMPRLEYKLNENAINKWNVLATFSFSNITNISINDKTLLQWEPVD